MSAFYLTIVTPSGMVFDGNATSVIVRTITGDIGILPGHIDLVAPLAIGAVTITREDGTKKLGAVAGGMVKVDKDKTTILTNACEWAEDIDIERAKRAVERAKDYMEHPTELHTEEVANIKLQRALNRIDIAGKGR